MDELLSHINTLYGLNVKYDRRVDKGVLSENHVLIQGKTRYFLKKYRFEDKKRIEGIQAAKFFFSKGGIPIILPLETKAGETFFAFNGAYFTLFPFIKARQFKRGAFTEAAAISFGETLGNIHLLGKEAKIHTEESFKPWNKDKALAEIKQVREVIFQKKKLSSFDKLALKNIEIKESLILPNNLVFSDLGLSRDHLIHGDYLDHNVFFDKAGKVSHVFDLEKADYSPRMYELFRSLMYAFIHKNVTKKDLKLAKLYLDSYLRAYPTSKEELKKGLQLFYFKLTHSMWVEKEHYLKNNTRADIFLKEDTRRLEYLSKHYKEFEAALI